MVVKTIVVVVVAVVVDAVVSVVLRFAQPSDQPPWSSRCQPSCLALLRWAQRQGLG